MADLDFLDFLAFDADNHYYEPVDAFTRHLDPAWGPRTVQWSEIDGRKYPLVGGRVNRAVGNPTFDPIAKAGAMHDYFRGNLDGRNPLDFLKDREPIPAQYREPAARLAVMDRQGLEKIWLFPTLGVLYEEPLKHDPEAVTVAFTAFNRWLLDDWTFNFEDRIFAAPYIAMASADHAVIELEFALDHGAHVVCMRPAAPTTATGRISPFDRAYDGFWGLANEAGIPVVIHAGDSGHSAQGYVPDEQFSAAFGGGGFGPSLRMFAIERAAADFLIQAVFEDVFVRFPNLRMCSIENGSDYLGDLFRKLRSTAKKLPWFFTHGDPVDLFREHVWINPFWEDDPYEIVGLMGADRVIFGSDWPHIEGMPEPLDYVPEVKELDPDALRRVMRDNTWELNTLRPG